MDARSPSSGRGDRFVGLPFASRSPAMASHGMVATSQPLATQVALQILQQRGTAVDAAIAANAVLGLVEPTGCGIGGDLFAIVWDPKEKRLHGLNASGRAPRGLPYEDLQQTVTNNGESLMPALGALPVTVPGAVDGWFMLHRKFGRLPMSDLLEPAIDYARVGFPVTPVIAHHWRSGMNRFKANIDTIKEISNLAKTFLIDMRPPRAGEVFQNPRLAETYGFIAKDGRDAFYRGPIADAINFYMERIGGYLRKDDLEAHYGEWVMPISTSYRGVDVFELPPNGQGLTVLQMLNLLEGFDLRGMGHNSVDYLHVHIEAKKLAYADRARYFADPAFASIPVEQLMSKAYADERRPMIQLEKASKERVSGVARLETGDTVYLTTADREGMIVSLIQSNYMGMGSGLVPDGTGFMLQNRGALFALDPAHPNVYAPGKRPFHTIIPAFALRDGEPFLSFGVMGGAMQPQGHVQILANLLDFQMNIQEAGDAARYRHVGSPQPTGEPGLSGGVVLLEQGIPKSTATALRKRGHKVTRQAGAYGGYQAIMWDAEREVYHGATEMRKDGIAAGY